MSDDPRRLMESGAAAPRALELLRKAAPSRAITPGERARTAARVAGLGAAPAVGAWKMLGVKGAAFLAGAGIVGLLAARGLSPAIDPPAPLVARRGISAEVANVQPLPAAAGEPSASAEMAAAPAEIAPPSMPIAPPSTPSAVAISPVVAGAKTALPSPSARASAAVSAPPPEPEQDALLRESAILERARSALRQDPESALAILGEHARKFPAGQLVAERELLGVEALRKLGRDDDARARARALGARYSSTPYAEQARRLTGAH